MDAQYPHPYLSQCPILNNSSMENSLCAIKNIYNLHDD